MKFRVSVDIEGELAQAFLDELGELVKAGESPSKADLGRTLIAEALQARGYEVRPPETQWGGHRSSEESDEGQLVAVAVA